MATRDSSTLCIKGAHAALKQTYITIDYHSTIVLRLKAVAACQITRPIAQAARRIRKSASFVAYWVERMKHYGHVNALARVSSSMVPSTAAIQRAQQLILTLQSTRLTNQQLKHKGLFPVKMCRTNSLRHLVDASNPVKHRAVQNKPLITDATTAKRVAFAMAAPPQHQVG